ncbi:MAG: hypothetical protein C0467_17210 [Planctomycetaceae bacterium]|nr:hypothetical protein [Planctomycetaceae bacterium]
MSLRSWAIRGLIIAGLATLASFGWVARSWVSPERIRGQVIATLSEQFEGAEVYVGDARLRLFGGIAVTDVRLTRPGAETPFLMVPTGVLSHDKEQLNRGRLIIKKIELENPVINLERGPDGKWNVAEVLSPAASQKSATSDTPVPTFIIKGATVHVTDKSPDPLPEMTLTNAQLTLLNDPLTVLAVQAKVNVDGFGQVAIRARVNRATGAVSVAVEVPDFPLGEAATMAAAKFAPELAEHCRGLTATASVTADLSYTPEAVKKWTHDVRLDIKDARYTHGDIPWPVEKITASIHVIDGRMKVEDATAQVNGAKLKLSLETRYDLTSTVSHRPVNTPEHRTPAANPDEALRKLEDLLQRVEISVSGVLINDELVNHLPGRAKEFRRMFSPVGQVDLGYKFSRDAGGWKRELEFRPKQIAACYEKFKYPVADVRGWAKRTDTQNGPPVVTIDLIGMAGGQLITIKGDVTGEGSDPGINLRITGANFAMDETLVNAFPPKYVELVRRFRATGRGDFVAEFVQQPGVNLCENEFRVDVRDATIHHTEFPYPLERVKGRLVIRTAVTDSSRPLRPGETLEPLADRDEIVLDGFTATHAGAAVWMNGSKRPIPNSRDRKLTLHVGGNNCPVDADLRAAFASLKVESVWKRFRPTGRITFTAQVELMDRAGPIKKHQDNKPVADHDGPAIDPVSDLKLTFNFSGPTVTPTFLPYELTDLSGWLEYKNGQVIANHVAARHGQSRLKMAAAEVRLYPDGTVWANLGGIEVAPFIADDALIQALPPQLGAAVEELKLKGGAELIVKHMVVLDPPSINRATPPEPATLPIAVAPEGSPVAQAQAQLPTPDPPRSTAPTIYWDAELRLTGAAFDTGVSWEQVFGALGCRGRYDGDHSGLVRGSIWLDRAVIARQPVTRLSGRVTAAPQAPDPARPGEFLPIEAEFTDIAGDLFHGALGGQGRIILTDSPRYNIWLTATDIQLDEMAKHYKIGSDADLKGIAQAQLLLSNRPDPKTGRLVLEGSGKIDVPTGRMYNLPVLLDLVKVLKLQAPDKTAFEEAHATFRIQGDRIKVDQVDLIGKALCLGGSGELDINGEYVKFDFYTLGSQVLARMINTPVGDLTAFLSKNLFRIKLTRENGELKYKPEAVPLVTEPARVVADRLRARAARMFTGSTGGTGK